MSYVDGPSTHGATQCDPAFLGHVPNRWIQTERGPVGAGDRGDSGTVVTMMVLLVGYSSPTHALGRALQFFLVKFSGQSLPSLAHRPDIAVL